MTSALVGPLSNCNYNAGIQTSTGTIEKQGITNSEGKVTFDVTVPAAATLQQLDVEIGGNSECVDTFTGKAPIGKLISRMLGGKPSVMITPMSTISTGWDDLDSSKTLDAIDPLTGTLFKLPGFLPTFVDHIDGLAYENSRSLGTKAIGQMTKINSLVSLGAGYISGARGVTIDSASLYMYQAMAKLAFDNGQAFDFFTMPGPVDAIKGGLQIQAASRRRSLQVTEAQLEALGSVMVNVFDTIEQKSSDPNADVINVVESITKVSIAAETEVLDDVKDLATGKVNSTAFKEANTAAAINTKAQSAVVPASFSASLQVALTPATTPKKKSSDDKIMGMDQVVGIIVIIVIVLVVVGLAYVAYRFFGAKGTKLKVLPVALDPTKSPDLEEGSRGGKLPPLESPGGSSSRVGDDDDNKVKVMPFVDSGPPSPAPQERKRTEEALKEQQEEIASKIE